MSRNDGGGNRAVHEDVRSVTAAFAAYLTWEGGHPRKLGLT